MKEGGGYGGIWCSEACDDGEEVCERRCEGHRLDNEDDEVPTPFSFRSLRAKSHAPKLTHLALKPLGR